VILGLAIWAELRLVTDADRDMNSIYRTSIASCFENLYIHESIMYLPTLTFELFCCFSSELQSVLTTASIVTTKALVCVILASPTSY